MTLLQKFDTTFFEAQCICERLYLRNYGRKIAEIKFRTGHSCHTSLRIGCLSAISPVTFRIEPNCLPNCNVARRNNTDKLLCGYRFLLYFALDGKVGLRRIHLRCITGKINYDGVIECEYIA